MQDWFAASVSGTHWEIRCCQPEAETIRLINSFDEPTAVVVGGQVFAKSQQVLRTILSQRPAKEILSSFAFTVVGEK